MPVDRRLADTEHDGDMLQHTARFQGFVDGPALGVRANGAWSSHVPKIIAPCLETLAPATT